jgi:hypothetical protein
MVLITKNKYTNTEEGGSCVTPPASNKMGGYGMAYGRMPSSVVHGVGAEFARTLQTLHLLRLRGSTTDRGSRPSFERSSKMLQPDCPELLICNLMKQLCRNWSTAGSRAFPLSAHWIVLYQRNLNAYENNFLSKYTTPKFLTPNLSSVTSSYLHFIHLFDKIFISLFKFRLQICLN